MAEAGYLRIQNHSPTTYTYTVLQDDWNCCDAPKQGYQVEAVPPGSTSSYFLFVRTDGHGCNGRQGQFAMTPSISAYKPDKTHFTFDSNGLMALEGDRPNYTSKLIPEPNRADGRPQYTWLVSPMQDD